jgi:hypothetical protein
LIGNRQTKKEENTWGIEGETPVIQCKIGSTNSGIGTRMGKIINAHLDGIFVLKR